jgi:hypothetical protein
MISWRAELQAFLAEHIDIELTLGAVFADFEPRIPLHHASRIWLNNHVEVTDAYTMRWRCFCVQLNTYHIDVIGGRSRGRSLKRDRIIIPRAIPCVICTKPLFAAKGISTHSNICTGRLVSLRKNSLQGVMNTIQRGRSPLKDLTNETA